DLAEGGDVANANPAAGGVDLAIDRAPPVAIPGPGEPLWSFPQAGIDEGRAVLGRPVVPGGAPLRSEVLAAMMAGEGPDGDRQIGRPRQDRPNLFDRPARRLGQHGVAVQLAGLALVGPHAECRVALQ